MADQVLNWTRHHIYENLLPTFGCQYILQSALARHVLSLPCLETLSMIACRAWGSTLWFLFIFDPIDPIFPYFGYRLCLVYSVCLLACLPSFFTL